MPFVLSEKDKDRISAEEILREEVRGKLARERSAGAARSFWTFLNSPLGIWFLSSVVVALFGYIYAQYSAYRSREADRVAQREKIADEVAFRIQMYERTRKAQKQPDVERRRRALDGEYPPHFIYPELANRTLVSMLWELAFLCDEPATKQELRSHARTFSDTLAIGSQLASEDLEAQVQSLGMRVAVLLPKDYNGLVRSQSTGILGDRSDCRSRHDSFWAIVDPQLIGWLLPVILVVLFALVYPPIWQHFVTKQQRRTRRDTIAAEVSFRILVYQRLKQEDRKGQSKGDMSARIALDGENRSQCVYPEFHQRSLVSLFWELTALCDRPSIRKTVAEHTTHLCSLMVVRRDSTEGELDNAIDGIRRTIATYWPSIAATPGIPAESRSRQAS